MSWVEVAAQRAVEMWGDAAGLNAGLNALDSGASGSALQTWAEIAQEIRRQDANRRACGAPTESGTQLELPIG